MPQITNRKLVGEMAATPSGQGTVYSAMLKASTTNRERAARVNDSERQKLQKATMVIDKHNRHNQWRCDQEIERVRQSLKKLDAFRRVLKEDYPAKNLIGKISPRGRTSIIEQNNAHSSIKMCADGDSTKDNRVQVTLTSSKPKQHDRAKTIETTTPSSHVTTKLKEIKQTEVTFLNNSEGVDTENDQSERHIIHDAIDIVTSANTTKHASITSNILEHQTNKDTPSLQCHEKTQKPEIDNNSTINADDHLLDKSDKCCVPASNQKKEENMDSTTKTHQLIYNSSSRPKPYVHTKSFQTPDNAHVNPEKETYSETDDPDTKLEMTSDQRRKQERLERLKAQWKTMMESRVCNRGFDMTTLRVDINRKMKRMDTGRQHREIKKCLLEESMAANKRIIRTSKATFDTVVMETTPRRIVNNNK